MQIFYFPSVDLKVKQTNKNPRIKMFCIKNNFLICLLEAVEGISFRQRERNEVRLDRWILVKHLTMSREILIEKLILVSFAGENCMWI